MGIAKGGVGNQQPLLIACPLRKFLRTHLIQHLPRAGRSNCGIMRRNWRSLKDSLLRFTGHFRIAVDNHFPHVSQQTGSPVLACAEFE